MRDAAGKRLMAGMLAAGAMVKAEKGQLADAQELADLSKAWKNRAKHDAKLDRREAGKRRG